MELAKQVDNPNHVMFDNLQVRIVVVPFLSFII